MKITFIVPTLNISGGLRVVSIYAQRLAKRGHIVTVVSPKSRMPTIKQRIKHALKWKGYQFKSQFDATYFNNSDYEVILTNTSHSVFASDVPDADVVIATWWETVEWISKFPLEKGKKVYFVQHLETHNTILPKARVEKTYQSSMPKITIAKWLVKELKEESKENIFLVPNSVEQDVFYSGVRCKQNVPTIGFLFSETGSKGITVALEVIARLKNELANLRVLSFGANQPKLIDLPSYIELSVNPAQSEIRELYAQCDIWLCCSTLEGFGLTVLEAMACRTPVVSTKCGGPEDIVIEGINGYLCAVDDVDSLTLSAFNLLSLDDVSWQEFSSAAFQFASDYNWDSATDLFEQALIESTYNLKEGKRNVVL